MQPKGNSHPQPLQEYTLLSIHFGRRGAPVLGAHEHGRVLKGRLPESCPVALDDG